jgi:hypothetical protein
MSLRLRLPRLASRLFVAPVILAATSAALAQQTIGNISTRAGVDASEPFITGFVIAGQAGAPILIRGVGPALAQFGVTNPLRNPVLTLFNAQGDVIARNVGWSTRPAEELAAIRRGVGAFPLADNSADSGFYLSLEPGAYTVRLNDAAGSAGIGLIELYCGNGFGNVPQSAPHLVNISSRCLVATGESIAIAGVTLPAHRKLLIRAVGPSLRQFGVAHPLADPHLTIVRPEYYTWLLGGGVTTPAVLAAENDDWETQFPLPLSFDPTTKTMRPYAGVTWLGSPDDIREATARCGAFPLAEGAKDSAMLVTIGWTPMSLEISGTDGGSGVALVEVYDVDGL